MKIAKLQMSRGAYFLLEHPARASFWDLPALTEVEKSEGVDTVIADQCMYGLYELCRAICRGLARQKQHDKIQSVRPGPPGYQAAEVAHR